MVYKLEHSIFMFLEVKNSLFQILASNTNWRKKITSSIKGVGKMNDCIQKKNEARPLSHTIHKNKIKMK